MVAYYDVKHLLTCFKVNMPSKEDDEGKTFQKLELLWSCFTVTVYRIQEVAIVDSE